MTPSQPADLSQRRFGTEPIHSVTVVVPAHNERHTLRPCVDALCAAAAAVPVPVEIIVVLDACDDDSASVLGPGVTAVSIDAHNVGAARRAGFAATQRSGPTATTWFATTDADSTVPEDWLCTHLDAAEAGTDAYVGTVTPDGFGQWPDDLEVRYLERYSHRPGHRHVHGANLGVRASSYVAVGGFRPLAVHEDVDLVDRLQALGSSITRCAAAPVRTSTRVASRVGEGFAAYLRKLATEAAQ
ncbi:MULTISPECIES: glycosyltransferase family 2 protein [unclassified Gordonia (in: high G+C Gram-positive bacteria)]|uniref:glycosyltransferase n=1 Tax=unclassified Gordonia (in: high G+C Gram-positive bacteria) TaxID=2657482 RepID=UPI001F0EA961|nr:glycosyltransferase [Gordonia sp. ABSL49_1]MCH5643363.1 glycosyltransferase [Gordonia sp. ABSL49_1]